MTFQERLAEGPPDEPGELLTFDEVRDMLAMRDNDYLYNETQYAIDGRWVKRLCRDYLTLWDRNKELEEHHEQFVRSVARDLNELTQAVKQL